MPAVKVDSQIWELIAKHYAYIEDPTPEDQQVKQYIADKLVRQANHDTYMSRKRIESYLDPDNH